MLCSNRLARNSLANLAFALKAALSKVTNSHYAYSLYPLLADSAEGNEYSVVLRDFCENSKKKKRAVRFFCDKGIFFR
jgi:hypothetical protein